MENFGTYLLRTGVISSAQLDEATQSQVIFGGRLGTNLAELGYLDVASLRKHLSDHLAIALPNPEWVKHPSAAARDCLPSELIEKFRVLPLLIEGRKLHLAMIDPRDPVQLDEIAFSTGLIVVPYVLPEVQLYALIEHYYGVCREIRYINLGREAARGKQASPKPKAIPLADERDSSVFEVAAEPDAQSAESEEVEDLIDEDLFNQIHDRRERGLQGTVKSPTEASSPEAPAEVRSPEVPAEVRSPEAPAKVRSPKVPAEVRSLEAPAEARSSDEPALTLEDVAHPAAKVSRADSPSESIATLEACLARACDRDMVSELALRIARYYSDAAALFVVRGEIVSGFRGDGERISEEISGILLTAGFDSSLTAPVNTRVAFRGAAPNEGLDAKILTSLGRGDVKEVAVFPILIRGQVVNLLYTDSGSDVLGETGFAALETLASLVSCAYERLILERKSALS
jgi:hypothetical protein